MLGSVHGMFVTTAVWAKPMETQRKTEASTSLGIKIDSLLYQSSNSPGVLSVHLGTARCSMRSSKSTHPIVLQRALLSTEVHNSVFFSAHLRVELPHWGWDTRSVHEVDLFECDRSSSDGSLSIRGGSRIRANRQQHPAARELHDVAAAALRSLLRGSGLWNQYQTHLRRIAYGGCRQRWNATVDRERVLHRGRVQFRQLAVDLASQ